MKTALLCAAFFAALALPAHGQAPGTPAPPSRPREYQVISVKGKVLNTRTGNVLQRRDFFRQRDALSFENTQGRLAVIDHRRQSFLLLPDTHSKKGYIERPMDTPVNTRPGKILNYLSFQQFLNGRRLLVIGDTLAIEIGDPAFAMNADSFFFIQYRWARDPAPVNKRLAHTGNMFFIERTSLFSVDGLPIDAAETSEYKLFYYNSIKPATTYINSFDLVFCNAAELREEVGILVENFGPNAPKEDVRNAVIEFIENMYGEPVKADLDDWLRRHWGL